MRMRELGTGFRSSSVKGCRGRELVPTLMASHLLAVRDTRC